MDAAAAMDWSSAGAGAVLLAVLAAAAKVADSLIHRADRRDSQVVTAAGQAIELWKELAATFKARAADLELLVDQGREAERIAHHREVAGLENRLTRLGEHVRAIGFSVEAVDVHVPAPIDVPPTPSTPSTPTGDPTS